jgi:hypothetical protein
MSATRQRCSCTRPSIAREGLERWALTLIAGATAVVVSSCPVRDAACEVMSFDGRRREIVWSLAASRLSL